MNNSSRNANSVYSSNALIDAILPFLPMQPVQILINNLLYDFSQTGIPFDNVDREDLVKPPQWKIENIRRFMIFIGPISSIFDYATYALMWFIFGAKSVDHQALFQTGWFVESLMNQTPIVHVIRTAKVPFFQSRASLPMLLITATQNYLLTATLATIIIP